MANEGILMHGGERYRYAWRDRKYRLERVTDLPGTFRVPSTSELVLPNLIDRRCFIVGESGGGLTSFVDWISREGPAVGASWERHRASGALHVLRKDPRRERPTRFLIDATGQLSGDESRALDEIARIVDEPEWGHSGSQLICVTRDVRALRGATFSQILARGHCYRLPHFDPNELEDWVDVLTGEPVEAREKLARLVKRWVGGQPFLTHLLFARVQETWAADRREDTLEKHIVEAGELLRDNVPQIVHRWREELKWLLEEPEVKRLVRAYAQGTSKDQKTGIFEQADADLFLAGWVGVNDEGRWSIRSACHREWVRDLVRGLR